MLCIVFTVISAKNILFINPGSVQPNAINVPC